MRAGMAMAAAGLGLALVIGGGAAVGAGSFEQYFLQADGGRPCYAQHVEPAFLAAHPRNMIDSVVLAFQAQAPDGHAYRPDAFRVRLAMKARDGTAWYLDEADCRQQDAGFACAVEDDGGKFTLTPAGEGLRLETGGLAIEGDEDVLDVGGADSDDRAFDLVRSSRMVCERPTTYGP